MPELDGYETLARIKRQLGPAQSRHHDLGVEEMESVVRCIELGATDYCPSLQTLPCCALRINASLAEKRLRDLEREYLEQVGYVADAADAVQAARFDPAVLTRGGARRRTRRSPASSAHGREVHLREQRLKQQLQQMHLDARR